MGRQPKDDAHLKLNPNYMFIDSKSPIQFTHE